MHPIKLKNWLIAIIILLGLSLIVDYYFIHILFTAKDQAFKTQQAEEVATTEVTTEAQADNSLSSGEDNFLPSLQNCIPEVAAQGIATPEALVEYFKKSIGIQSESDDEWTLKDQSQVSVELQENLVTKLKYVGHGRTLECQLKTCLCQ
jgi:hypothetical protein